MSDTTQISDVDLIRLLGEYTTKADTAHQRYLLRRGVELAAVLAVYALAFVLPIAILDPAALNYLIVLVPALGFGAVIVQLYYTKLRTPVELAVWQLRRVYELVSRREDLGVVLDSGTRLELELRLSEAAFLLSSLQKFERPEKFQQFRRVGSDSPMRVLEPDDSQLSPNTNLKQTARPSAS